MKNIASDIGSSEATQCVVDVGFIHNVKASPQEGPDEVIAKESQLLRRVERRIHVSVE